MYTARWQGSDNTVGTVGGTASTNRSSTSWRDFYIQRAANMERDGEMSRAEAEARAYECSIVAWLNHCHPTTPPDRCAHCGVGDRCDAVILPFGTDDHGHAWIHDKCWSEWSESRRRAAIAALEAAGVLRSSELEDGP